MSSVLRILVAALAFESIGCDRDTPQGNDRLRLENSELQSQNAALHSENAILRQKMDELERERDELKFGPTRLLSQVERAAQNSDWTEVKEQAANLISRHPGSPEAANAKQLLMVATSNLAKAAKEAEVAEARRLEAEKQQKLEDERRLATALSKMHKKVDSIENVPWYRDQSSPQFTNYNGFFLYIGKQTYGEPWLRLRIQYNAEEWLFIESFLVVADGQRFEYPSVKFERDNSSEIWEWYDEPATSSDLNMANAIIASKTAVIRFNGRQYRRDRTITAAQKAALRNVLDAYKVLGGR